MDGTIKTGRYRKNHTKARRSMLGFEYWGELKRPPFVVDLSMDFLCLQVRPPMDYAQHEDIRPLDLIDNAVGLERQFPDFFTTEFQHDFAYPG